MALYENLIRPLLFRLDPEEAHYLAAKALPMLHGNPGVFEDASLATSVGKASLANPVGLAAGFDKNGYLVEHLAKLGFGFAEVGSITAQPSTGNAKPRLFRLPDDEALINRLGLNGEGAKVVAQRLSNCKPSVPMAANLAKTNDPEIVGVAGIIDQIATFLEIRHLPLAYVTINASCPNTHDGCLEATGELDELLAEVQQQNDRALPIFLKLSPDSNDELLHDFVGISTKHKLAGFVCGNTTVSRDDLDTAQSTVSRIGNGGLSGPPLKPKALSLVRRVARLKQKDQQIIGCGGISSGSDAFAFIEAGCSAVQIYTALVYHGPTTVAQINRQLAQLLKKRGMKLTDLIGSEELAATK